MSRPQAVSATMFWIVSPVAVTRTTWPGETVTGEIAARSMPVPETGTVASTCPSTDSLSVPAPWRGVKAPSERITHGCRMFWKSIVRGAVEAAVA